MTYVDQLVVYKNDASKQPTRLFTIFALAQDYGCIATVVHEGRRIKTFRDIYETAQEAIDAAFLHVRNL